MAPACSPTTGTAFGNGIYFSDSFLKSSHYSDKEGGHMLVCEVALGKIDLTQWLGVHDKKGPKEGYDSVLGRSKENPNPKQLKVDKNGVGWAIGNLMNQPSYRLPYNEFVVYDTSRVKIRYIIKL